MIKGLYNSASAMIPHLRKQEVIANNLANVSSPGFKKDEVFVTELNRVEQKQAVKRSDWEHPMIDQVYTDYEQGSFNFTSNPLDVALEGDGFFVVQSPEGEEMLTRDGALQLDDQGFVIDADGNKALGTGGPIQLPAGEISISNDGIISVDDSEVAQLRVESVDNPNQLDKVGGGQWRVPQGINLKAAVDFTIRQGYLESSNVNVITQMVDMITSYRNYESDSQALKSQDESLEKLINEMGRPL